MYSYNKVHIGAGLTLLAGLLVNDSLSAAGFYLSEVGTPHSLGTAGVANPTNVLSADSSWTNPAGMTGLDSTQMLTGMQVALPEMKFDSKIATVGGGDGGNAGEVAMIPSFFYVNKLSDDLRLGFSVTAPISGGIDYGDNFVGRYVAQKATLAGVPFRHPSVIGSMTSFPLVPVCRLSTPSSSRISRSHRRPCFRPSMVRMAS